ncbi:MAG: hypothetical protein CMJ88_02460 [Planctomycetes bacterium]|nr:hypothetical protein [Planctomycetota bacterium]
MASIQVVAPDYSGMAKDVGIIRDALASTSFEVAWGVPRELNVTQKLIRKSRVLDPRRHRFCLNILIQAPFKWMIQDAAKNCLIPNPEWFSDMDIGQLRHVSEVWCKSESAVKAFRDLGCKTRFIGFCGRDVYDPVAASRPRRFDRCLHVSGSNAWKGTQVLLDTWLMHPEWPHLTIVCRVPIRRPAALPPNVTFDNRFVPEDELRGLFNSCGINIQPTEMEGYGHSLAEAMSSKAVVLVTNGAPMNERVDAGQVVFIEPARQQPHYRGRRYFVTPSSIEAAMEAVLSMSEAQRSEMGEIARRTFLAERAVLPGRLRDAVAAMI